jgi:TatD DNase family protein
LIETDSPYLSPEPLRGKRNDSRNVKFVAEKISNILERDIEDIAKITYENTNKIFNI